MHPFIVREPATAYMNDQRLINLYGSAILCI